MIDLHIGDSIEDKLDKGLPPESYNYYFSF